MPHDVFISYSTRDSATAEAVCAKLESREIKCWIAPRDISPGPSWSAAIIDAIEGAHLMVVLFSSHANLSEDVKSEVERARGKKKIILPVLIEDVQMTRDFEYFFGTSQWLDATARPFESHLDQIANSVRLWLIRSETVREFRVRPVNSG